MNVRDQDLEMTRFSLKTLAERASAAFEPEAARAGTELVVDAATEAETDLIGPEAQIDTILGALVDNALTHGAGPVRITVSAQARRDGQLTARFKVEDSGPGMAPEVVPIIFERRPHPERPRGAIGLASAKELTERLGGRMGAMSAQGIGSTFWFELPLRRAPTEGESRPERLPVLVVEDDAINRMVVTRILEREGYEIDQALDGPEAIDKALAHRYALVLMDVRLPTMDGLDATKQIRAAQLPGGWRNEIVALTAHALPEYHQRCLDAGMDDYLTKPLRKDLLLSIVAAAQRRAQEQLAGMSR